MSPAQILAILRARWWIAVLVLIVTVAATVGVTMRTPKMYTANAVLIVDTKPDPVSSMMFGGMASPLFMATQVEIIQSDRVAARVVRNLKLVQNPQVREQWVTATEGKIAIETWLGEMFQKAMLVQPGRASSVLNLTYRAPDPDFAAALANAFAQAYLETGLEMRVDPAKKYSDFFDVRSKDAREKLEAAQTKLSTFQQDKGVITTDERLDIENAKLNTLSSQLVALQALASESGVRQAQAQRGSVDEMQEVMGSSIISGLKGELSRSELRLQEMSNRLGDNHPQVVEVKLSIEGLKTKIETETRRATSSVGVSANINRQRVAELRASLETQRTKLLQMKGMRDEGAVLARDVESAQRAYDAVVGRLNQSTLESTATLSNVSVLTPATPPQLPSSPQLGKAAGASVLVGLMLGLGLAFGIELLDRRVRTKDDVSAAMGGLAVLGVLPKPAGRKLLGGKRATPEQARMVSRLPAPAN